jgi:(p)ppGpp synthase/HD superfamily hydrolase
MGPLETVARRIATKAHEGQVDHAGAAYIFHPYRVASRLVTDEEKAVAWLHDVIEDTDVTADDLRVHFPETVVAAVIAITRLHQKEGDSYYGRVASNKLATRVKRADIADNMDPARLEKLAEPLRERLVRKYTKALTLLPA